MKRGKKAGIVWRPTEIILLVVFVVLVIFLVWAVREIDRQDAKSSQRPSVYIEEDSSDISHIVQQSIETDEAADAAYDSWERSSSSSAGSAADDIGSVFDETSY